MEFTETRKTLKLAYPVILGELAQMSFSLIDVAMVGAVSYKHLAAGSLVASVINIPFILGIGITISVAQMVSMASGQRDKALVSHYLFNGFMLCGLTAIIISFILEGGKGILFHLGQDAEVAELAVPYMSLMGWSVIPMLLFMSLKQFTDGLEFTKTAMILSVLVIPVKLILNYMMIFGNWGMPRMELVGAGWASLISRSLVFIALAIVVMRHSIFKRYIMVSKRQWYLNRKTWQDLLYIGIPSSLQLAMESGAFAVSGILVGMIGAREQAAHQITLTVASMTFMVSIGLSQAGSIRTSNAFGRKDWPHVRLIGKTTIGMALFYGVLCAIGFTLFRTYLPQLFNDDAEVIAIASTLMIFAAFFQISDSTQAISAGLLRGIKDVQIPTLFIFIAYWVIGLPIGSFLAFNYDMKAAGVWIGFIIGLTVAAFLLSQRFFRMSKETRISHSKFKQAART
ncbi:MAG: MATE family efflux transporter [Saprospiraceae bacterium]|nr:MAG: MATE efflux family protein [Bacteroidetes bacterium OLB9]MCO6462514.1 MATE family efflux transporter [Saprospiraceae bacterium]MCZ2338242.1 MATE family efflux transporter [Chitinophagales bacterium]